jgi:CIC family chloride channel protein
VTSITLGSGASGGIFSPSLFIGATLGSAYGQALHVAIPIADIHPAVFALAGMAGVVAGGTGAALTAVVMIFEMTLNYAVILPMTLTVAVSYGLRRIMMVESIYTMKLTRRGHVMPEALLANARMVHHVGNIACHAAKVLNADSPTTALQLDERRDSASFFVVVHGDSIAGVVSRDWALEHPSAVRKARQVGEIAQRDYVLVSPETTMFDLMAMMQRAQAQVAVILQGASGAAPDVKGVVTKADIGEALAEGMELFGD